ncbi:hypothetical protein [Colwellia sp. PAMC 20917]|uniref:hypothetical protein n=1 Tax=Colwellia sp. PAMC 20917 TaxID=1816218 RepID=UPI000AE4FF70|nr:hypothetical protein [Colwellia sp. PAMC 20917]
MGSVLGWMIFAVVLLRWYANGKDKHLVGLYGLSWKKNDSVVNKLNLLQTALKSS